MRLDAYLVENGAVRSRERAKEAIKAGLVRVNGETAKKLTVQIKPNDRVECDGETHPWVSRGALKLVHALSSFDVSVDGLVCVDIGASTGGFTEVLLSGGAEHVYAVDVGRGQLADKLAQDPRVTKLEQTDARELGREQLLRRPQVLVSDVSFISIKKALPVPMSLCETGAMAIILVKPQFELGRAQIGKGGLVKLEVSEIEDWLEHDIVPWLEAQGWAAHGYVTSPIKGGDGNTEFLLVGMKQ